MVNGIIKVNFGTPNNFSQKWDSKGSPYHKGKCYKLNWINYHKTNWKTAESEGYTFNDMEHFMTRIGNLRNSRSNLPLKKINSIIKIWEFYFSPQHLLQALYTSTLLRMLEWNINIQCLLVLGLVSGVDFIIIQQIGVSISSDCSH